MKLLLLSLVFLQSLFAFGESIQSFQAQFTQTITDETGKVLTYEGHIHTKRPSYVLWDYTKPEQVAKKIYANEKRVVIVQPLLEQATIKSLRGEMNFFKILSSAKKVDETHYKARYQNMNFILKEENGVIISLEYQDELENQIHITFSKQRQNRPIDDQFFTPKVPKDFDIIRE